MNRLSLPSLSIAGLVVLILLAYMCTYQVGFSEVGIKVRLGKADESSIIREPGIGLKWPRPIESVTTYDVRLRTLDTSETEIKTVDGKNIIIGAYAVWTIENPLQFFKRVREIPEAEKQMRSRLSQAQAAVVGQSTLADFVSLDVEQKDASHERLLKQMVDSVSAGLQADYGIAIKKIGIRRISLPPDTTKQVFASMIQERNKLAARYRQEGKSRADGIKARAESSAKQLLAFADRRAQEIRSAGIQASARILAQIPEADRDFFEWLRWLDALRAALAQKTTIFLDQKSPFFEPFVHPPVPANDKPVTSEGQ